MRNVCHGMSKEDKSQRRDLEKAVTGGPASKGSTWDRMSLMVSEQGDGIRFPAESNIVWWACLGLH